MKEDIKFIIIMFLMFILGGVSYMAHNKVYGKCENFCDVEVMAKDDVVTELNKRVEKEMFAVISDTFEFRNESGKFVFVDYPEGFNKDNTIVISQMCENTAGGGHILVGEVDNAHMVKPGVELEDDGMTLTVMLPSKITANISYKVVIMNTDYLTNSLTNS